MNKSRIKPAADHTIVQGLPSLYNFVWKHERMAFAFHASLIANYNRWGKDSLGHSLFVLTTVTICVTLILFTFSPHRSHAHKVDAVYNFAGPFKHCPCHSLAWLAWFQCAHSLSNR